MLRYLAVSFRIHLFFLLYHHLNVSLISFVRIRNVLLIYVVTTRTSSILMSSNTFHRVVLPYLIVLLLLLCGGHVLSLVVLHSEFGIHILLLNFFRFLVVDGFRLFFVCSNELLFMISGSCSLSILDTVVRESQERLYTDIISTD